MGLSIDKAGLCVAAHTIGVIAGSFAAGWYVQRPRSFRNSGMGIAITLGVACAFMYFWMLQQISFPVGMLLFTLAGCAIGAYVIIVKVAVPVAVSKAGTYKHHVVISFFSFKVDVNNLTHLVYQI